MAGIMFARLKNIGQHIMEPNINTGISPQYTYSFTIDESIYAKIIHSIP